MTDNAGMRQRGLRLRRDFPWARRIVEARLAARLTQGGLGARVGVSQSIIADYEAGRVEPSVERFRAIAVATGTTAPWLIFGIDDARAEVA